MVNSVANEIVNDANITCGNAQSVIVASGQAAPGSGAAANAICSTYTRFDQSSIVIDQSNTSNCTLTSSNITQITTKIKDRLTERITNWIQQNLDQNGGWLQTALNIASTESISRDQLVNNLTNLISNDIRTTCSAYVQDFQNVILYFCGYYTDFHLLVDQKLGSLAVATCLNKTIVQSYASNSVLVDIVNKTDQAVSQVGQGLFGWIVIIVIVIAVIGLIGTIVYYHFQSDSNQTYPYTNYPMQ